MSEDERRAPIEAEVEATGETVGEAKWSALRELEQRFPGVDQALVRFEVVSKGERGLLGVGYSPARVVARLLADAATAGAPESAGHAPGSPAARLHELLDRVCAALGARVWIRIAEEDSALVARLSGRDLGLVIGKHGQTIDAIQSLANAIVYRRHEGERKEVVIDAAGYRDRRRASLEGLADRAADEALRSGDPVALDPMTPAERKIVHLHLKDRGDVATASEGAEPSRRVVVRPAVE